MHIYNILYTHTHEHMIATFDDDASFKQVLYESLPSLNHGFHDRLVLDSIIIRPTAMVCMPRPDESHGENFLVASRDNRGGERWMVGAGDKGKDQMFRKSPETRLT